MHQSGKSTEHTPQKTRAMFSPAVKGRNYSLDALRGIAFLAVLFEVWMVLVVAPRATSGHVDFVVYYSAGHNLLTNPAILYDFADQGPYIHPAYEVLLFAPFALLGYRVAYLSFVVLNIALIAVIWWSLRFPWELLAFAPIAITIVTGQDSILLLACCAAAWWAAHRNHRSLAGVFLGLGMFRFQDVLPIIVLLVTWQEWNALKGWAVSSGVVGLISGAIISPIKYYWLVYLLSVHPTYGYWPRLERMVNLRGLIHATLPQAETLLLAVLSTTVLAICYWFGRRERLEERLSLGMIAACLVSYSCYPHDLVVLTIPMASALRQFPVRSAISSGVLILASLLAVFSSFMYLISLATLAFLISTIAGACPLRLQGPELHSESPRRN
jgi:hypothetical protein